MRELETKNVTKVPLNKYMKPPYCYVCHFIIYPRYENESKVSHRRKGGNGVFIDQYHILTSAHNLCEFDKKIKKKWVAEIIDITPCGGMQSVFKKRRLYFGSKNPKNNAHWVPNQEWVRKFKETTNAKGPIFWTSARPYDYAVIRLLKPIQMDFSKLNGIKRIDKVLKIPNILWCGSAFFNNKLEFRHGQVHNDVKKYLSISRKYGIKHGFQVKDGHSGSPLFIKENDKFTVMGNHSFKVTKNNRNYATMCDTDGISDLQYYLDKMQL